MVTETVLIAALLQNLVRDWLMHQTTWPAALRVRVGGAAALEIQHMEPQIIERVNGYFGYRAIDRLQLVQGPLPAPPLRRMPPPLDAARARAIETKVAGIGDPDLRAALARLGSAIARRQPR